MWRLINIAFIVLSACAGFVSMAPQNLQRINSDVIACISVFLAALLVTVGGTYYGVRRIGPHRLSSPSLNRSALGAWQDPLQYIFLLRWMILAALIAATSRLCFSPSVAGGWLTGTYVSALLGIVVGEAIVYRRFRDIIGSDSAMRALHR